MHGVGVGVLVYVCRARVWITANVFQFASNSIKDWW